MKTTTVLGLLVMIVAAGCAPGTGENDRLHDLFDREWEFRLQEFPELATSVGVHEHNDRLTSVMPEDLARRDEVRRGFMAELDEIDADALSIEDRINYEIFRDQLEDGIESYRFGMYQIPFNADSGFQTNFARLPFDVPLNTVADYENYIARLRAWPAHVEQQIELMRAGLERGMTQPRLILDGIEGTMEAHIVDDPASGQFFAPFREYSVGVAEAAAARLTQEGKAAIVEAIVPAYTALRDFFVLEYIPGARETLGAHDLPDGEELYAWQIRSFTTLEMTADEIHELGLREVARIRWLRRSMASPSSNTLDSPVRISIPCTARARRASSGVSDSRSRRLARRTVRSPTV